MGITDFFTWRSQAVTASAMEDEEVPADVDEPPEHQLPSLPIHPDFHKSIVRPRGERKESLLTKAIQKGSEPTPTSTPDIKLNTDLSRRRSMTSNASLASTAELTSDGGFTSPARTNTPSPPIPRSAYSNFATYSFASKPIDAPTIAPAVAIVDPTRSEVLSISPKAVPVVEPVKKRCITFVCDGQKGTTPRTKAPVSEAVKPAPIVEQRAPEAPQPRRSTIKFACPGPKPTEKTAPIDAKVTNKAENQKSSTSRSPTLSRKSPKAALSSSKTNHDVGPSARRTPSPAIVRAKPKNKFIVADEMTINTSEATRFHEFCSEEPQVDDWIRKDSEIVRERKLTINDTLKMENAIRQLGNEAEEEALEDEEDEDDDLEVDDSDDKNDSDANDSENDLEDDDESERDEEYDSSDDNGSDGNETDNEAGFADSDEESDGEGDFSFWTPGRRVHPNEAGPVSMYRATPQRTASTSSIDSLDHMILNPRKRRPKSLAIKIRPGTPELPDSTDFVCGTLDEDRPLEDAYISCMAVKNAEKHRMTPQDIDPSFPVSDIEDEEDENDEVEVANDSEEHVFMHGKFEESDHERTGPRRSTATVRKSPLHSPRRLHSPPPPNKTRYRSPPPRKMNGHSPRRMRSPPAPKRVRSQEGSFTATKAIQFAAPFDLRASRPGLTLTKSLPRTPNAFCRQYNASRLAAANGNGKHDDDNVGHVRGAIDIVRGLEQKRQRRKEKFLQKQCNRKKGHKEERRPLPGKGAERMRELGLLMAGKTGRQDPYMLSA